ncbi:hypothetical protein [Microlunatus sp. Gsoil 973]|uniref:hypothetical protein n=1 Tax=Microlunatus sp. Gsoil 973 TaxID=2672569 RepID=UPI0018A7F05A|nr:hypothetical protein [Microlunatus sp. Gsoil 973]
MVNNNTADTRKPDLALASKAVWGYVGLTVAALIAPVVMTGLAPQLATDEAWGHQIIVAVFAVLLPLRMRAARRGSTGAVRAVMIIAVVVGVVNLVEAVLPVFPLWMRIVMLVVVVTMAALVAILTGRIGARTAAVTK